MIDGVQAGGGPFESVDPKLTVFALANGMDLAKGDGYRRLEWFTEGLERAIVMGANDDGTIHVGVMAWRTGHAEARTEAPVAEGVGPTSITSILDDAIATANELGPPAQ